MYLYIFSLIMLLSLLVFQMRQKTVCDGISSRSRILLETVRVTIVLGMMVSCTSSTAQVDRLITFFSNNKSVTVTQGMKAYLNLRLSEFLY